MAPLRRGLWSGLCLLALGAAGCNILEVPFFLFGPEPSVPAQLQKLASEDKEKEVSVLILASTGLETRSELVRADRDLVMLLTKHLREGCKYNQEKVKVISSSKVERFQNDHPDWQKWDLPEIGSHFKADYVIYLEISSLSLYEKGSLNQLFRGRAAIDVSLIDMKHPDEPPQKKYFTGQYPTDARPPVEVGESNPMEFRRAFLDYVAKQISWYFTSHPTDQDYSCQ
jgi:hypothetical protein